jgi:hypothetical protein
MLKLRCHHKEVLDYHRRVTVVRLRNVGLIVLLELAERGIIIRRIIAHSFTSDGIRLMRNIGFTETPPKAQGLRDFMVDIESSGIPLLREYKQVLKNSLPLGAQ